MDFVTLLFLVAAVVAGVIIWRANSGRSRAIANGNSRRRGLAADALDIRNVGEGGVFSLRAFGDDMADLDVSVVARHLYDEDGYRWHELEGETGGQRIWLTLEEDDGLELSVTLRKLRLEEAGLDRRQIEAIDDSSDASVNFEGRRFHFDDRGEAVFFRHGERAAGERFTYWEFYDDAETRFLTIERWSDGSFECHLSQAVRENQITVYSLRAGD